MSESKKIWIAFAVVGVLCCCMAGGAYWGLNRFSKSIENMAKGDPTAIAEIQEEIAEFDIPSGYQPMAMSLLMYDIFYLTPETPEDGPMIMLMQYGGMISANREEMERSLREAAEQQNPQPGVSMQVVDSFETVIRGETVTVTVSEGETGVLTMRQWMAIFEGNNGPVILMIQGDTSAWDDQMLKDFIQSIK
ncbi:MAG: hypothetical protein DPW18_08020 [Chloroflexi bacterium]|nr:hypothetical protein [Chloroflexota bacterium]MDL1942811.1 hypothetical protein [Chloroflexi bacterium CFX2]